MKLTSERDGMALLLCQDEAKWNPVTFKIWSQLLPSLWIKKVRMFFSLWPRTPFPPFHTPYSWTDFLEVLVHPFLLLCEAGKCFKFSQYLKCERCYFPGCECELRPSGWEWVDYKCMQYIHAYWDFCHWAGWKASTMLNVLFVMCKDST